MCEIRIKLNIPKNIVDQIDLEKVKNNLEKEIMIEYTFKKLHGCMKDLNLNKILQEVEEEWAI